MLPASYPNSFGALDSGTGAGVAGAGVATGAGAGAATGIGAGAAIGIGGADDLAIGAGAEHCMDIIS